MNPEIGASPKGAIAIVGMSGRFPGARSIEQFWRNVRDGVESRVEYSEEELAEGGVAVKLRHPRHVKAGFPLEDYDMFDSAFFGINPREAEILDPQHRLFLECAWHALENAGYDSERFPGRIGIFGGSTWSSYLVANLFRASRLVKNVGYRQLIHGSVPDYMVTRAAYRLNLKGPACYVQTACSTSLVAVHLACHSLLRGETDMALAGGVSVAVPHRIGYIHEEGGMESPDGRVRAFDARARGTVFGSGVALVVVRRLEDALRDGDTIHAIIRGTAVNNDGAVKVGFTAPGVVGQAEVITQALGNASVQADEIDYVEAHGTGTELGDPIELAALARAYGALTTRRAFCAVGSVKPNIGHLDAAAGVSSLIKTVLSIQHGQQAPSINCETLNPKIELEDSPFFINTVLRPWPDVPGRPRRAGVSSFGFGGTNAHVILEQAPEPPAASPSRPQQLLVLSARTPAALEAQADALAQHLTSHPEIALADAAFTLRHGRRPFAFRKAIVASGREQAIGLLQGETSRFASVGQVGAERRIVFLFPGQGSQYVNMARGLFEHEPVFRAAVDDCAQRLVDPLGCDLRDVLYPAAGGEAQASERLTRTLFTQTAVFTVEYALATLWMHWGITPAAMVGHSIGEFVAACLAGVMSLDDALQLVALRGRLMEGMPEGAMLAVPQPEARVRGWLTGDLWLAASNSPSLSVVSGTHAAIADLERRLAAEGVEGRRLHTSHAFHSGLMDGAVAAFVEGVRAVRLSEPTISYLSNVTGGWATTALVTDPSYWGRHIRDTVRFADNVAALLAEPESLFIEVGPGTALSTFVRQQVRPGEAPPIVGSMRHPQEDADDLAVTLAALGRIWTLGVSVDWSRFAEDERRRRVPLPGYAFERTRHWVEPDKADVNKARRAHAMVQRDDVGDWFYVPSWRRTALPTATGDPRVLAESWVIFADRGGVGDALAARLVRTGVDVTLVRIGAGFAAADSGYSVDPTAAHDYIALVSQVFKSAKRPGAVVHLWSLDDPAPVVAGARDPGFYSLLYFSQALGTAGISSPLALTVVTSGVSDVTGEEAIVPQRALVLGPTRVMGLEYPTMTTRHVDVQAGLSPDAVAAQVLAEAATKAPENEVSYRSGRRWVQTFEPVRLESAVGASTSRLRDGGTYLITGGFGGIGLVLAEYLARTRRCNLVLTGRRALPVRAAWMSTLTANDDPGVSRIIRAIEGLEAEGAQVMAGQADVTDEVRMRAVVDEAYGRFGRIDGVVHAAGVAGGGVMQLKTAEAAERVLAPKVAGTEILGRLFAERRLDFMVLCSSLTSVLGGVGQVDYCAANAYLDAYARWYTMTTGTYTLAVNWTAWQEVGMAVETDMPDSAKSTLRERMLAVGVTNQEGADAFARMLAGGPETQMAVSPVDVQLMLDSLVEERATEAAAPGGAAGPAASGHTRPDLSSAFAEPRTETERQLCAIWRDLLGIQDIGINDSFFELGGHSLLAVRTMARINEVLGTEVPVAKLYEGLTVGFLAQVIDRKGKGGGGDEASATEDADARERRREKARRQKEHQQRRLATSKR